MDELQCCRVWIVGWREMPFSRHQAVAAYARLLQIPFAEACDRLAGMPVLVRSGLGAAEAGKYLRVLERMGFACRIVRSEMA